MNDTALLDAVSDALASITVQRFYETERGFQGQFLIELKKRLRGAALPRRAILEQEYQKRRGVHGLGIRPDLIIHQPFDPRRHSGRNKGNSVVFELKLRGRKVEAEQAFRSLVRMIDVLHYPIGIFINIGSSHTLKSYRPRRLQHRIVCFAVRLDANGVPRVRRS